MYLCIHMHCIYAIEQIQFSIECARNKCMLARKLMPIDIIERKIYHYLFSPQIVCVATIAAYALSRYNDE